MSVERRFSHLPRVLLFAIKRFKFLPSQKRGMKVESEVLIPEHLSLKAMRQAGGTGPWRLDNVLPSGESSYSLVGVISHLGRDLGSGHYIAHCRRGGSWYEFSDSKVLRSTLSNAR